MKEGRKETDEHWDRKLAGLGSQEKNFSTLEGQQVEQRGTVVIQS